MIGVRMKLAIIFTAALLPLGAAHADPAGLGLREALAHVPVRMTTSPQGIGASFVNFDGLRRLGLGSEQALGQRVAVGGSDAAVAFLSSSGETWRGATGLDHEDVASLTDYGSPPSTVVVWGLADPARTRVFVEGLAGRGFRLAEGVWSNGEPMKLDLARRDPRNPFLGPMGRASMIVPFEDGVSQSADPASAAESGGLAPKDSLIGLPILAAALDVVQASAAKGVIAQVIVLTPAAWTRVPDIAGLPADPPPANPEAMALAGQTSPTIGAMVADIETTVPPRRGVVIALPYGDCGTAERAGRLFGDQWSSAPDSGGKTAGQRTGTQAVVGVDQQKGVCVTVVSLFGTPEKGAGNAIFRYVINAIMRRDFAPLQGK